ncbi:hypothetical protein KIN20_003728 [Parelaphostrongylus tenuis]|uniref:Uncharacterized protein n=1 Tax=Parelaphostrongylus tenuis TaxID=148309 RepID=A0AAD5QGD0_PARTN|nr:hypothetical protein KIN20_003728 [Parelaphostrongylus tenuis]
MVVHSDKDEVEIFCTDRESSSEKTSKIFKKALYHITDFDNAFFCQRMLQRIKSYNHFEQHLGYTKVEIIKNTVKIIIHYAPNFVQIVQPAIIIDTSAGRGIV